MIDLCKQTDDFFVTETSEQTNEDDELENSIRIERSSSPKMKGNMIRKGINTENSANEFYGPFNQGTTKENLSINLISSHPKHQRCISNSINPKLKYETLDVDALRSNYKNQKSGISFGIKPFRSQMKDQTSLQSLIP